MAYVALYRQYRPLKFDDVVGQENIIKTLKNAINLNKVAHAYLFCGPRGTGKTTLAKILAKSLNCEQGPTTSPCCTCEICEGIQKGMISDVVEIDAASNNGADDIRALRDTVKYLPATAKYKVYIIDEVHMLSNAAFNALLKTLEEPPKHVVFILATTEPYKLPNTILSRCQRFDFQPISLPNIKKRLRIVADSENIKVSDEAIDQIAVVAEGGMRDALSILDQSVSYATGDEITLDDILQVSGNISYIKIIELLNACISSEETQATFLLDKILKDGKEVPRIINDIIIFLRDTLLFKNNAILEEKIMYQNNEFKALANELNKKVIYNWLDILNEALNNMRFSTQKRAFLELAILKMNDNTLNEEANVLDRLESLESMISKIGSAPAPQPKNERININIPSQEEINRIIVEAEPQPVYNDDTAVKNEAKVVVDDSKFITTKDIERVLNNANKYKKDCLLRVWNEISARYPNVLPVQIMCNGEIVAVCDDTFVVELQDVGFCNRVMKYENYLKIIEIFNEYNLNIKDYICVPRNIWSKIKADYLAKFRSGIEKPELNEIEIGVLKRIIPTKKKEKDPLVEMSLDLFGEEIKIVED
ncbi:MAG: DNA polymerase III subunit gamma/tau [Acholeplasmatales bacterium]|nr:DNA polymerase III subunit gamma/tau [Acholeplasmatales bacterium]